MKHIPSWTVFTWSGRSITVQAQSAKAAILQAARTLSKRPIKAGIRWQGPIAHIAGMEFHKPIRNT